MVSKPFWLKAAQQAEPMLLTVNNRLVALPAVPASTYTHNFFKYNELGKIFKTAQTTYISIYM